MPDVDADRDPELLADLVHGVVAGVVDRRPGRERHHAHHREARVLGELADAAHVAGRPRRVGEAAGDEEAARVRVGDLEQLVGGAVEPGGEDAGRDAELVHQREQPSAPTALRCSPR